MMADHQCAILTAEVHSPTLAIAEEFAVVAWLQLLHPLAIAIWFKAILPYLPEVILIDIALIVLTTNTGESRNTTVNQ